MLLLLCFVGLAAAFRRPDIAPGPFGAGAAKSKDCIMKTGEWTPCSASCGGGQRRRRPTIVQEPTGYGAKCPDLLEEVENCNVHLCPIDCELEAAAESQCSASCGVGTRTRASVIVREAKHGGKPCPPPPELIARVECRSAACPPPIHCAIEWSDYGPCAPCGPGTKTRTATIVRRPQHGGSLCPEPSELTETITCFERPCQEVFDCQFIVGGWGQCSATCGHAFRVKSIYIISQPINGGKPCPSDLEVQEKCQVPHCPVRRDCEVSWGRLSQCTRTCGGGTQTISGEIITQAQFTGAPCPRLDELKLTLTCADTPCLPRTPRDCVLIQGARSACSVTCGGGFAYSSAWIQKDGVHGGKPCPHPSDLITTVKCNAQPCPPPRDCEVRRSYWGECSRSCGGGIQTRAIEILRRAENGGLPCPTRDHDTRSCNSHPCSHGSSASSFAQASSQSSSFGGSGSGAQAGASSQSFGSGFGGSGSRAQAGASSQGGGSRSGAQASSQAFGSGFGGSVSGSRAQAGASSHGGGSRSGAQAGASSHGGGSRSGAQAGASSHGGGSRSGAQAGAFSQFFGK